MKKRTAVWVALAMGSASCVFGANGAEKDGAAVQCVGEAACQPVDSFPSYTSPAAPAPGSAPQTGAAGAAGMETETPGSGTAAAQSPGGAPILTGSGRPAAMSGGTATGANPAGSSGTAPAAGAAGAPAATGGDSGELEPGGLQCPNEVCPALPDVPDNAAAMGFSIVNCCTDSGDCGTSINDGDCTFTPDSDPQCPQVEVMGFMVPACCTMDGKCGVDGSSFMMGCISLEDAMANSMGLVEFPAPQACTPMATTTN